MAGRLVLGLLLVCVAADAAVKSGVMIRPNCPGLKTIQACPMNFAPVCGSDGNTYANECLLCVQIQQTKMDIFIVKKHSC